MRSDDAPDPNEHVFACIAEWCKTADELSAARVQEVTAADTGEETPATAVASDIELQQPRFPEAHADLQDGPAQTLDTLCNDKNEYEIHRMGACGADVHRFVKSPLGLGCAIQARGEIGEPVSQWRATRSFASHFLEWWSKQDGSG
jgi:hypothetical protein